MTTNLLQLARTIGNPVIEGNRVTFVWKEWVFTYNQTMQATQRLPYVWDYDLDQTQFLAILEGRESKGRLNQDWAACRLLEYAPYEEIIRLIGFRRLVENWSRWRGHIRSQSRVRGFDFVVKWIPEKHPELLHG